MNSYGLRRRFDMPVDEVIDRLRLNGHYSSGNGIQLIRGHLIEDLGIIAVKADAPVSEAAQNELADLLNSTEPSDPDDHQVSFIWLERLEGASRPLTLKAAAALKSHRAAIKAEKMELVHACLEEVKSGFIFLVDTQPSPDASPLP
jgi:hypothetical protein